MPENTLNILDNFCTGKVQKQKATDTHIFRQMAKKPPPRICLFQSDEHHFLLDVSTNRIFSLQPTEVKVFSRWLNDENLPALAKEYPNEVKEIEALRNQGLFCNLPPQELAFGRSWEEIRHGILNRREHTILELTQQCNLRCRYCVFSGGFRYLRTHNATSMTQEMVRAAIDDALECGKELDELFIGFYGGEPLLFFDRLKDGVEYALRKAKNKKLNFSLTTNGTVLDEEKGRFLKEADFTIMVSIDGPRYMHDRFRVFKNGKGSYNLALRGLRTLLEIYDTSHYDRIGLNMVVPSSGWFTHLQELWDDEPWIPRTLRANGVIMEAPEGLELPSPSAVPEEKGPGDIWLSSIETTTPPKTTVFSQIYDESMAKFHKRPKYPGNNQTYFPNGCCMPGLRKIFVRADGAYGICERADEVPAIGSIEKGVDIVRIKSLIDEYIRLSFKDCKDCFAISNCTLCFKDAYENGAFRLKKKRQLCSSMKSDIRSDMELYGYVSEHYPHKLKEWDAVQMR